MKSRKEIRREKSYATRHTHFEKKSMHTFVTGLCLLGMGLGVNIDEALAGMKANPTTDKIQTEQPSVKHGKLVDGVQQPSVKHGKLVDTVQQPSVQHTKMPANPSVNRVKPVPANKTR